MLHRLRLLLLWLTLAGLLALFSPVAAAAATDPLTSEQSLALLQGYAIVRGDPSGSLLLDHKLTRAQAAAIFVRARGAEGLARMVDDMVPFVDAKGHWAAGEIAIADRMGLMKGDGDGRFRPEDEITYAEVYTVLLRLVEREPTGSWDPFKAWEAAERVGFAQTGINVTTPAIRGSIFWSLAVAISQVPLPTGQTVLQKYVDSEAPKIQMDNGVIKTKAETVTISGRAPGAVKVSVEGKPAALDPASGTFRIDVLPALGNNSYAIEAQDWAGNRASAGVTVERLPDIASIRVEGAAMMRAGTSQKLTVTALDPRGQALSLDGVKVELSGDLAVFNLGTRTLTVGKKTGRGALTLRYDAVSTTFNFEVTDQSPRANRLQFAAINGGSDLTTARETEVRVHVMDANNQPVTDDYWRQVSLTAEGALVSPAVAEVQKGVATFKVTPVGQGTVTLRALSPGLSGVSIALRAYTSTRVVLTSYPASLPPDGLSTGTIRAELRDADGRPVANETGRDIVVDLLASGSDGTLTVPRLTIRPGQSHSAGSDAQFRVGILGQSATITGRLSSAHDYSIVPLTLGMAPLPGVRLVFAYPTSAVTPGAGGAFVDVQVVDVNGQLVTTGAYAFQLSISTSNGDAPVGGLPPGVQLTMEGSAYRPVGGGTGADPTVVVGRTYQGAARLRLNYDRSGILTLSPVLLPPSQQAYHPTAGYGPASASAGMTAQPFQVTFAGEPREVRLTVDSALGQSLSQGAGAPGSTFRVRAAVVDSRGATVPGYSGTVTLSRTAGQGVTTLLGGGSQATVGGVTEFSLSAGQAPGYDRYVASVGSLQSVPVTLSVRTAAPDTPVVAAVRGGSTNDPSPVIGYVGPEAQYLEVQLAPRRSPVQGEPSYWALVRVYRKGSSSPLYAAVIDLSAEPALVRVPKSLLPAGREVYEVSVYNGYAESARSSDLGLSGAVNAAYQDGYTLQSAWFDAESGKLSLVTGGIDGTGVLTPGKLTIVKDGNKLSLANTAVTVVSKGPSGVELNLGALAGSVDPSKFQGAVVLRAESGWYASSDGAQVARAVSGAPITPMAALGYALLDAPAGRLYLQGVGFTQGTLDLGKIGIGPVPIPLTATDQVLSITDTSVTIALSAGTLGAIQGLASPDIQVTAQKGWLKVTNPTGTYNAGTSGGRLYTRISLTSASYDRSRKTLVLRGSGFTRATLNPVMLAFRTPGSEPVRPFTTPRPVEAIDDSTIEVVLSDDEARAFQVLLDKTTFLNTDRAWLTDPQGIPAITLAPDSILFVP